MKLGKLLSAVAFVHAAAFLLGWALTNDLPECLVVQGHSETAVQYLTEHGRALTFPPGQHTHTLARTWIPLDGAGRDIVLKRSVGTETPHLAGVFLARRYALQETWDLRAVRPAADGTITLARRDAHLDTAPLMRLLCAFEMGAWLLAGLLLLLARALPAPALRARLGLCAPPALAASFVCTVVAPLQSYLGNADAFGFSLSALAAETVGPFCATALVLYALLLWGTHVGGMIPPALLAAGAVWAYLQLGILSIGYPELDGDAALGFFQRASRGGWELLAAFAATAALFALARWTRHGLAYACGAVALLAGLSLFDVAKSTHARPPAAAVGTLAPHAAVARSAVYAPQKNVLVYVLDRMSAPVFQDILRHEPSFAAHFPGFICFTNTVSMHPRTTTAVPGYMTGKYLENPAHTAQYANTIFGPESFVTDYRKAGCDVFFMPGSSDLGLSTRLNDAEAGKGKAAEDRLMRRRLKGQQAWNVYEVARFRLLPCALKATGLALAAYGWNVSQIMEREHVLYPLLAEAPVDAQSRGALHIWHTIGSHAPYECDRHGLTDAAWKAGYAPYFEQSWYVLSCLTNLLGRLQARGLYDSSFIVVTADHGNESNGGGTINKTVLLGPLLLVKPVGATRPFADSDVPTCHSRFHDLLAAEAGRTLDRAEVERLLRQDKRLFRVSQGMEFDDYWLDAARHVSVRRTRVTGPSADAHPIRLHHRYSLYCSNVEDPAPIVYQYIAYWNMAGPLLTHTPTDETKPYGWLGFRCERPNAPYTVLLEIRALEKDTFKVQATGGRIHPATGGWQPETLALDAVSDATGRIQLDIWSKYSGQEIRALEVRSRVR